MVHVVKKTKGLPSYDEVSSLVYTYMLYIFDIKTREASGMCIFVCFNDPKDTPVWIIIKLFLIFCCGSCFRDITGYENWCLCWCVRHQSLSPMGWLTLVLTIMDHVRSLLFQRAGLATCLGNVNSRVSKW